MGKREIGRLGGLQTYLRHGSEHMRQVGQMGGRPKFVANIFPALEPGNGLPNSLAELKRLMRDRQQRNPLGI